MVDEIRVGGAGVGDDAGTQPLDVVRAQQLPARAVGEGEVDQSFMVAALDEGGVAATGPRRFTDAAETPAGQAALFHEVRPERDDRRRVATCLDHVDEAHVVRVPTEPSAEQIDLLRGDGDEHGLLRGQPLPDERERRGEELCFPAVQEGLVAKGRTRGHVSMTKTSFRSVISSTRQTGGDGHRRIRSSPRSRAVWCALDHALQSGGVEERDLPEIEHDRALELLEYLRQFTDRAHVEVATDGDDTVVGLDLEHTLGRLVHQLLVNTYAEGAFIRRGAGGARRVRRVHGRCRLRSAGDARSGRS